jgi:hypothetical protein
MSRSYRKNFVFGICSYKSEKSWRQSYNRIFRKQTKQALKKAVLNEDKDYNIGSLYKQHYADPWLGPSDGYCRLTFMNEDQYIADKKQHPYMYHTKETYKDYCKDFKKNFINK